MIVLVAEIKLIQIVFYGCLDPFFLVSQLEAVSLFRWWIHPIIYRNSSQTSITATFFRNARARKFSLRCAFAQLWHQRAVAGRPSARSVDLCMSERGLTRLRISYGRWWTGYEEFLWPLWGCWKRCVTLPGERKRNCWPEMFEWGVAAWHGNQCCISPSGGVGE